jgi:hypothetical protein
VVIETDGAIEQEDSVKTVETAPVIATRRRQPIQLGIPLRCHPT